MCEGLESAEVTVNYTEHTLTDGMTTQKQQAEAPNTFKEEKDNTLLSRLVAKNIKKTRIPTRKNNIIKYTVKNAGTGQYLTIKDGSLALTDAEENIIWTFEEAGAQTYALKNNAIAIDVPALSKEAGTELIVYASNGGDNQKWIIQSEENGYVRLISKCSNLSMEIVDGKVIQNNSDSSLNSINQKWILTEVVEKEVYTVKVNGEEVKFSSAPYRPDTSSGVLCAVRPVLDALGVDYTYDTSGRVTLTITQSGASLTEGETTISIGNETNLTNAEFFVENGELIAEIAAVLEYAGEVSVITDADTKTVTITN